MDWNDDAEQAAFRSEVRAFIQERLPEKYRAMTDRTQGHSVPWFRQRRSEDPELRAAAEEWARALAEKHWVAPHWPREYGGAGLSTMEQFIFGQELGREEIPTVGGNGMMMLGPTVILHGTEEQKARILPGIVSGEVAWVQGYSEPGAGSDLASLTTRAVRDGDEYVSFEGAGKTVAKWTSGPTVRALGEPTPGDVDELAVISEELKILTGLPISFTSGEATRKVYFIPQAEFTDILHPVHHPFILPLTAGYFQYHPEGGVIKRAEALISSESPEWARRSILREEFTQAFGLLNDTPAYVDSVFYSGANSRITSFSALDRRIIGLHYLPEVKPGMTAAVVRGVIEVVP